MTFGLLPSPVRAGSGSAGKWRMPHSQRSTRSPEAVFGCGEPSTGRSGAFGRFIGRWASPMAGSRSADRVFVRRYAFYDQNIGVVLGRGEALVIDTRSTYGQAREILADLRTLTADPSRSSSTRTATSTMPSATRSSGPRRSGATRAASRSWSGPARRARRRSRPNTPELAGELDEVVIDPPDRTFASTATVEVGGREVALRYLGRGHTDHDIVVSVPGTDVLFAGRPARERRGAVLRRRVSGRLGGDGRAAGPARGPGAGRRRARSRRPCRPGVRRRAGRRRSRPSRRWRARVHAGEITLEDAIAAHPFPEHPPEDARATAACGPGPAPRRAGARMSEVLWNVRLLDLEAGSATERRAVTIDDGLVTAIDDADGPAAGRRPRPRRAPRCCPGSIDAHCHVLSETDRSPGFGPPPLLHGEAPRPAALGHYILAASARCIVRSGFTTVRDVGSFDDEASALKLAVDLGVVPGPRILTCGRIVSATAPGGVIFGTMYREADGPWEMRKAVREQIRRGADYIKFMATGARSVVAEDPEPPQMTLEEMTAIVDEAHRMGRRVAAHAEGLAGTRWAIEAGADTIEHGLALHRDPSLLDDDGGPRHGPGAHVDDVPRPGGALRVRLRAAARRAGEAAAGGGAQDRGGRPGRRGDPGARLRQRSARRVGQRAAPAGGGRPLPDRRVARRHDRRRGGPRPPGTRAHRGRRACGPRPRRRSARRRPRASCMRPGVDRRGLEARASRSSARRLSRRPGPPSGHGLRRRGWHPGRRPASRASTSVTCSPSDRGRRSVASRSQMARRRSIASCAESMPSSATPRRMNGKTVVSSFGPEALPLAATAAPVRRVRSTYGSVAAPTASTAPAHRSDSSGLPAAVTSSRVRIPAAPSARSRSASSGLPVAAQTS